ncbi:MAG: DUF6111 family protein [Caulobacteraceae bacterium]
MLKVVLIRLAIFALPFAVYFVWREAARRGGRPMGSTPWPWLVAAGALLAALSLVGTVIFPRGPDTGTYVPGEVRADGSVAPGHFVAPAGGKSAKANP